jgi:G3E family GTPase
MDLALAICPKRSTVCRMVPVVVLTGFLGSGKTTLLNRLLQTRPPGRGRFAVIVNEFGDVGIDGDLLPEEDTRQVELPGGCVCCALVEDLRSTIVDLVATTPDLELILIETTGIADPLPISWTLASESLASRVRLAAVVTVVDPLNHETTRTLSPSVDAQVRYADLFVVSKLDVGEMPPDLVASLRSRNPVAPLIAERPKDIPGVLWTVLEDPPSPAARPAPGAHLHAHDEPTESISMPIHEVLDLEELVAALEALPAQVFRVKGIVRAVDKESGAQQPGLFVVHRVGARVSTEPYSGSAEPRVVALGTGLDCHQLSACFSSAVLPSYIGSTS